MAQFLRPDSNVTQSNFTGGFADIDESTASDADFAFGANNTAAVLEVGLSNPAATPDPAGTSTVRYRIAKTNAGTVDGGGNAVTVTGAVYQGGTLIQSDSARSTSGTWTGFSFTFTHGSITDWTDVRLRFTTSASGGGPAARRGGAVSWAEVEAPDAAPNAYTLSVDAGTFTVTGNAATLLRTHNNAADAGSYTLTGNAVTLTVGSAPNNYVLDVDAGTFTFTGNPAGLQQTHRTIVDAGSYVVTGNNANLLRAYRVIADAGTYTVTGSDAALRRGYRTPVDAGSYVVTGNAATLQQTHRTIVDAGSYVLTGNPATLSQSGALNNYTLSVDKGTFILTGNDAALLRGHRVIADLGKFFLPERNLRRWSESFDNGAWTKTNASITANATIAPDGTLTADALIENTTQSVSHSVSQNIVFVAGRTYTASCYFKLYPGPIVRRVRLQLGNAATFTVDTYAAVNLEAGTITTVGSPTDSGITSVGNGWYRVWVAKVCTRSVTSAPNITLTNAGGTGLYTDADGLSGNYIWGAQHEEGSLSDYDPTGPNAATRFNGLYGRVMPVDRGLYTLTGRPANLGTPVTTVTRYILIT